LPIESLISQLRSFVGDLAGDNETFSDEELQAALARTLDGVAAADAVDSDYDLELAAADVCELWAARLVHEVDFSDGQRGFKDSQKREGLIVLAGRFRQRSSRGIGVGRLTNGDLHAGEW